MHITSVPSRSTQLWCSYFDCTFTDCSTVANSDLNKAGFWHLNKITFTHQNVRSANWQPKHDAYTIGQFVLMLFRYDYLNNCCLLHWLTKWSYTLLAWLLTIIITVQVFSHCDHVYDCSSDIILPSVYSYACLFPKPSLTWTVSLYHTCHNRVIAGVGPWAIDPFNRKMAHWQLKLLY